MGLAARHAAAGECGPDRACPWACGGKCRSGPLRQGGRQAPREWLLTGSDDDARPERNPKCRPKRHSDGEPVAAPDREPVAAPDRAPDGHRDGESHTDAQSGSHGELDRTYDTETNVAATSDRRPTLEADGRAVVPSLVGSPERSGNERRPDVQHADARNAPGAPAGEVPNTPEH